MLIFCGLVVAPLVKARERTAEVARGFESHARRFFENGSRKIRVTPLQCIKTSQKAVEYLEVCVRKETVDVLAIEN